MENFVNRRVTLENADLTIGKGQKICISGLDKRAQSDFFYSLCSENYLKSGGFHLGGKVSYCNCDQDMILKGESVRANILFGEDMNSERYETIINTVNLNISYFSNGDKTIMASNGKNYSMNEVRRILLARAVYKEADIYLITNYFGFEDEETEKMEYSTIIRGLLKDKTVIFDCNITLLKNMADKVFEINVTKLKKERSKKKSLISLNKKVEEGRTIREKFKSLARSAYLAEKSSFNPQKHIRRKSDDLKDLVFNQLAEIKTRENKNKKLTAKKKSKQVNKKKI